MIFVKLLEQNCALFNKSKTPYEKLEKEQAARNISDVWLKIYGEELTYKKVMKKFYNMKDSIKYKLKMNDHAIHLLKDWEKRLIDLFKKFAYLEGNNG